MTRTPLQPLDPFQPWIKSNHEHVVVWVSILLCLITGDLGFLLFAACLHVFQFFAIISMMIANKVTYRTCKKDLEELKGEMDRFHILRSQTIVINDRNDLTAQIKEAGNELDEYMEREFALIDRSNFNMKRYDWWTQAMRVSSSIDTIRAAWIVVFNWPKYEPKA